MAQRRKTREEIEAEEDAALVPAVLQPITPLQQILVETLLSGKSITEASTVTGVPRRTATRWLSQSGHPVRVEYEKQRLAMLQEFKQRIATIQDKALQSIDEALSENAPIELRFAAAKFIYQQNMTPFCNVLWPRDTAKLVDDEAESERARSWDTSRTYLSHIAD